ncbi:hypothetical protein [Emcibacter sp. SYSU 3D8]|uniref:beta strand repeat-containing protein n=1 Tax=Emcibacter sp. SYSU 3D8 TaxID=3133969 RepID=UPI0031FE5DF3
MLKLRVLTGVSAVALATAFGMSGAKANNLIVDLTAPPGSISVAAGSSASAIANDQFNESGGIPASVVNTLVGFPAAIATSHDVGGGIVDITVSDTNVFAVAKGNEGTVDIDFFTADNGGVLGDDGAATAGLLQWNDNNDITATITTTDIQVDVIDLGAGSSADTNDNSVTASGTGNLSGVSVAGTINFLQLSSEAGQADVTPLGLSTGATALSSSVQVNSGAPAMDATVTDTRIGLLARVDGVDTTAIVGVPLEIIGNVIGATFTGNDSANEVSLEAGGAVSLVGSAGAANLQINAGDFNIDALVDNATIEAGDSENYVDDEFIADLDGSSLALDNNSIVSSATSNASTNSVALDDTISQDGPAVAGDQENTVDFGALDSASVSGDLFVSNAQFSSVGVNSTVDDGDVRAQTEDVDASQISVDGNVIAADAAGSRVTNTIEVGNATSLDSLVAISSIQYTTGLQSAEVDSADIELDIASDAPNDDGDVTDSSVTADGNEISAAAIGNAHASTLDITGVTITGVGGQTGDAIEADRDNTTGFVSADFSILNAQVLDGGGASAELDGVEIDVEVADITFTTSSLSVSGNEFSSLATGNLSSEASILIDAVTIDATVGVANSQTVEDGATLSSDIDADDTFIEVGVGQGNGVDDVTVDQASINVDDNLFSSRVWGNLADSTTNSIIITGVTVGDAGETLPEVFIDRLSDPVSYTAINAGIALLNDQSVEDLNGNTVTAQADGDLIDIDVGDDAGGNSLVQNSEITANENTTIIAATLNQATSKVSVDAVTLDASSSLVNVQTLADEDGVDGSAQMLVDQDDLDIDIDVIAADNPLLNLTVQANDNSNSSSARINLATNTLDVSSQTQVLSGTIDSTVTTISAEVGPNSTVVGENTLVNDQAFFALGIDGVDVNIDGSDITIDLSVDGNAIESTLAEIDGNSLSGLAAGNDATNTLIVDVATFDLDNADLDGPDSANGPIATLVSNQWGQGGDTTGGFSVDIADVNFTLDANDNATSSIDSSDLSVDGNTVRALARINNVVNTLDASGTSLENSEAENPILAITEDGVIVQQDTSMSLASRQVSSVGVSTTINNTQLEVLAGGASLPPFYIGNGDLVGDINDSSISADSNLVVAESRGSDGFNTLSLDYIVNEAQAFLSNLQYSDEDVVYDSSVDATEIVVLANVDGSINDSSFSANGNAVAALSSGNRATNDLNSDGTNVVFRNSNNVLNYDPTNTLNAPNGDDADVDVRSSLAVVNVQGDPGDVFSEVDVDSSVTNTLIGVISNGIFDSGSIAADNNLVLASSIQHSASNSLNITASANITAAGIADNTPGASVLSLQTIGDGSDTTALVDGTGIVAVADDPRGAGSFTASANSNEIRGQAIGGSVVNSLTAVAGASINAGAGGSSPITGGTDPTIQLDAAFNVLNMQFGDGATMIATVNNSYISAAAAEDYNNDAVTVEDNLVQAEARGFTSINVLSLDAGSSSNAMAALANVQELASSTVSASIDNVGIFTGNLDEGATDSSLTVDNNIVEAVSGANRSSNLLITSAGATLQESSGAGVTIDPGAASRVAVTGADYALVNDQRTDNVTVSSTIRDVDIGIDGLNETTGVDFSALNVQGNEVRAIATGNEAVNQLVLNTGTFQHPSSVIGNSQSNDGTTVTASVTNTVIGIGENLTLNANSNNSSFTVRGNSIGATAIGNSSINVLRAGD